MIAHVTGGKTLPKGSNRLRVKSVKLEALLAQATNDIRQVVPASCSQFLWQQTVINIPVYRGRDIFSRPCRITEPFQ